jgi:hypothetical protein
VVTPDDVGFDYHLTFLSMRGGLTWGATVGEATALDLEGYAEDREPYPVEERSPRLAVVEVDPLPLAF